MLETFKAQLKAKSKASGANLSQKRIDVLADRLNKKFPDLTEDADHEEKINDLYDAADFKEMATIDDYNRAKEAKEKKEKADADRKAGKTETSEQGEPGNELSEIKKQLADLTNKLLENDKNKTRETNKGKLLAQLKDAGIPSIVAKGYIIDNEDQIESVLAEIKTEWETELHSTTNEGLKNMAGKAAGATGGKSTSTGKVDADIVKFAKGVNDKAIAEKSKQN